MKSVVFKLTWQTRTANLQGELRGSVLDDHRKDALVRDWADRGFRVEEISTGDTPIAMPDIEHPIYCWKACPSNIPELFSEAMHRCRFPKGHTGRHQWDIREAASPSPGEPS